MKINLEFKKKKQSKKFKNIKPKYMEEHWKEIKFHFKDKAV